MPIVLNSIIISRFLGLLFVWALFTNLWFNWIGIIESRVNFDWAIIFCTLYLRVAIPVTACRHRLKWQAVPKALATVMRGGRCCLILIRSNARLKLLFLMMLLILTLFICVCNLGLSTWCKTRRRYIVVMLSVFCILAYFSFIFVIACIVDVKWRRATMFLFVYGIAFLFFRFACRCIQRVWVYFN